MENNRFYISRMDLIANREIGARTVNVELTSTGYFDIDEFNKIVDKEVRIEVAEAKDAEIPSRFPPMPPQGFRPILIFCITRSLNNEQMEAAMKGHVLAHVELVGTYEKTGR